LQRKLHGKQTSNDSSSATLEDDEEEKAPKYKYNSADASQLKQTGRAVRL
jgi:hypothetical protein